MISNCESNFFLNSSQLRDFGAQALPSKYLDIHMCCVFLDTGLPEGVGVLPEECGCSHSQWEPPGGRGVG